MEMLKEFLKEKNMNCSEEQLKRFEKYVDLTLEWNEKINVTAIRDRAEFIQKNLIDSLTICSEEFMESAERVMDMGTGGGLPGMPLAIAYPDKQFVLVDSVGKKLKVIDSVCAEIGITNVKTIHARAEDLAKEKDMREGFDLCVSRAMANMSSLSEYCLPFVKKDGIFCAYKTEAASEEIAAAAKAIKILGGAPVEIRPAGLTEIGHIFAVVKKVGKTPGQYPRKAGLPVKQPIV